MHLDNARVPLDDALLQTEEMILALQQLHHKHDEQMHRADTEVSSHAITKAQLDDALRDHANRGRAHEQEKDEHSSTQAKLEGASAAHSRVLWDLYSHKSEIASLHEQNEFLRVQLEARHFHHEKFRSTFLAGQQSAADREASLTIKIASLSNEHDRVDADRTHIKSSLDFALHAQDRYRKEYHSIVEAQRMEKEKHANQTSQLSRCRGDVEMLQQKQARIAEVEASLVRAQADATELREQQMSVELACNDLRKSVQTSQKPLSEAMCNLERSDSQIASLRAELSAMAKTCADVSQRLVSATSHLTDTKRVLAKKDDEMAKAKAMLAEHVGRASRIQDAIDRAQHIVKLHSSEPATALSAQLSAILVSGVIADRAT